MIFWTFGNLDERLQGVSGLFISDWGFIVKQIICKYPRRSIGFHYPRRPTPSFVWNYNFTWEEKSTSTIGFFKSRFIFQHTQYKMIPPWFIKFHPLKICCYGGSFHLESFVFLIAPSNESLLWVSCIGFCTHLCVYGKSEQAIWTNLCWAGATACNGPYLGYNFNFFMRTFYDWNCYKASFILENFAQIKTENACIH